MEQVSLLEQLPNEILTRIAVYVANRSSGGPPTDLVHLLSTSRTLYRELKLCTNTRLYAEIFRTAFDIAVIQRRFGRNACCTDQLAAELQRRFLALRRIRAFVKRNTESFHEGQVVWKPYKEMESDLWCMYLIALEHDQCNLIQLHWAHVRDLVDLHAVHILCSCAARRILPEVSLITSLHLHLRYALVSIEPQKNGFHHHADEQDHLFIYLKPFVFADHTFDMFLAPWTELYLPRASSQWRSERSQGSCASLSSSSVFHCGQTLKLAIPPVSRAAIALIFECTAKALDATSLKDELDKRVIESSLHPATSLDFDLDFARLKTCYDYSASSGLRLEDHIGRFNGVWEGRFAFFDIEANSRMLQGNDAALYDGTLGEQTQVLRLSEAVVSMSPDGVAEFHQEYLTDGVESTPTNPLSPKFLQSDYTPAEASSATARSSAQQPYIPFAQTDSIPPMNANSMLQEWRNLPFWTDSKYEQAQNEQRELLLYGTGHSAWGRFLVRGRVRIWDGLVVLLKEYGPERQGRWLYRGYCDTGNKLVGRWRDAYTPSTLRGYEGPFFLNRRS
ncbi:hypothetical protein MYAM1_001173 [Malassezia yamatoensis]|uniref:F-box domain-containing protein n=1 Tax=Malassezia yamatoensis TaxID=253288 RepID=A0AAJ5YRB3_9BASI|nr:hypothetical protein MYAM1_001173 [Malassezia yamatoensis]